MSSRSSRRAAPQVEDVDDIWKLAGSIETDASSGSAEKPPPTAPQGSETFTLFVGQKQAGKSSLITAFHNPSKDEAPKPTVALEYLFARRSSAPNQPKDVAHIWELGGGARLSALVSVPWTPRTIGRAVAVVVVDLTQPHNLVAALGLWLDILRQRVDECVAGLRAEDPAAAERLMNSALGRFGPEHPDLRLVKPLAVPCVVLANKLDKFKDRDSTERRTVYQALRFFCHAAGATLLTVGVTKSSERDKASQAALRQVLTMHLFNTGASPSTAKPGDTSAMASTGSSKAGRPLRKETSPDKPLLVPAGSDSFEEMLKTLPKGADRSDFLSSRGLHDDAANAWGRILDQYFGPASPAEEDSLLGSSDSGNALLEVETLGNAGKDGAGGDERAANLFAEPAVDEARAQRDTILAQYRKDAERKLRAAGSSSKSPSSYSSSSKPGARGSGAKGSSSSKAAPRTAAEAK